MTDAGTPAVSDPGGELVAAWAAEGGLVVPIPGASAVLAAVAGSGVAGPRWAFEGFLPRSGRDRRERLARIAADERGTVLYEAPGRVAATLRELAAACGRERPGAVCRELTKLHETIVRGSLGDLAEAARPAAAGGRPGSRRAASSSWSSVRRRPGRPTRARRRGRRPSTRHVPRSRRWSRPGPPAARPRDRSRRRPACRARRLYGLDPAR